jgi:hypothetical protein
MTFVITKRKYLIMKKLILLFAISVTLLFSSCEGPTGPPGADGINILGQVFEVTIDFTPNNNYSRLITFPNNIEVYESDVILVYLLEETVPGNGGPIDVWSQLPQTYFLNQGTLLYTFDHTFLDVKIFLDVDFDLGTLGPAYTDDQVFRIAVVPSEFGSADISMDELMDHLEIDPSDIINLEF